MPLVTLQEAERLLRNQEVVAIPTDTVYGLAALLTSEKAVQTLFQLKKRPSNNPLLILAADLDQMRPYISEFPPHFDELAQKFWPGGLTLVVPVDCKRISQEIRAGKSTAGFRVPEHSLAIELLKRCGPLVTTSANLSGYPAAITVDQVLDVFPGIPILDGGDSLRGVASTILCFEDGKWRVTREGSLSLQITQFLHKDF